MEIQAITEQSERVKTLVDEVNLGSQEQAKGIEQVAKAITQMEQVTQTTAASAEESASAASELTAQSESVQDVVAQLAAMGGSTMAKAPRVRKTVSRPNTRAAALATAGTPRAHVNPRDSDFPEF